MKTPILSARGDVFALPAFSDTAETVSPFARARLSYSERSRLDGNPVDRLAFSIASRVARDYFARLTSWSGKDGAKVALVMHARTNARKSKRKLPSPNVENQIGFTRASVEHSTLEEMALAARAVLLASRSDLRESPFTFRTSQAYGGKFIYENDAIKGAFRAARRALNREREQSLESLGLEKIPTEKTDEALRDQFSRERFLVLARDYCARRRALLAYWSQTGSRKWRAGFAGDCAVLRNAFDVAMGSGHGRDKARGSAFRERVSQLRTRLEAGALTHALAACGLGE